MRGVYRDIGVDVQFKEEIFIVRLLRRRRTSAIYDIGEDVLFTDEALLTIAFAKGK